jgi:flagellar biosynthetic protein FliR
MEIYVSQFVLFLLIFARVISMVAVAPVFGHESIPVQIKVGLSLFFAFVLYSFVSSKTPAPDTRLLPLAILVLQEAIVGLIIGFAIGLVFAGIRYAGELIGFDMGLSMAQAYDPENAQQMPLVGEMFYLLAILLFLSINGHHFILEAIQLSYRAVPPGHFAFSGPMASSLISLAGMVFVIAVKISAPVIVAGFLTNIALSILARVMPQMNIFSLSFPLKIGVGLLVLAGAMPLIGLAFRNLLAGFENNVVELVKVL